MNEIKKVLLISFLLAFFSGCQSFLGVDNATKINIDFQWSSKSGCSDISPPIQVNNIPEKTHILKFKMVDLDYKPYNHGGGEVLYQGNAIPEGALKSYGGPCPPNGSHTYEITVQALNKEKNLILGEGVSQRKYPE